MSLYFDGLKFCLLRIQSQSICISEALFSCQLHLYFNDLLVDDLWNSCHISSEKRNIICCVLNARCLSLCKLYVHKIQDTRLINAMAYQLHKIVYQTLKRSMKCRYFQSVNAFQNLQTNSFATKVHFTSAPFTHVSTHTHTFYL